MNTKGYLAAAASGIALLGCATMVEKVLPCNSAVCFVEVTVSSCSAISALPNPVHIGQGTHNIQWNLQGTGWSFTDDGIWIKNNSGKLTNPMRLTPTKFQWTDNNNDPPGTAYHYGIKVTNAGQTCTKDPDIMND